MTENKYEVGQLVVVVKMNEEPYNPVPPGAIGLIEHIDDEGKLFCRYINNERNGKKSSLPLIPGVDEFKLFEPEDKKDLDLIKMMFFGVK